MQLSSIQYYLSSIPTLLSGIKNAPSTAAALMLSKAPRVIELDNGIRFKVRSLMDVWIIKETCLDRDYERASINIEDGWTVMDIGAALGDFAVSVGKAHPNCKVIAYEPFPNSFDLLQENMALNGVDNVTTLPIAIGGERGTLTLQLTGEAVQHATASVSDIATNHIKVKSITLDDALRDIDVCDYLKVDCEGAEFDIFVRAQSETLRKVRHICLEFHDRVTPYSHTDLARFFELHGFEVTTHANPVHANLGLMYARNTH